MTSESASSYDPRGKAALRKWRDDRSVAALGAAERDGYASLARQHLGDEVGAAMGAGLAIR